MLQLAVTWPRGYRQSNTPLFSIFYGSGANGKSCLLEKLLLAFGDYAISAPANFLMAAPNEHATEIARLQGARFVVCSEINQGTKFDEAKWKTADRR